MQEDQINQYIESYTSGELKSFSDLYEKYNQMIRSVLFKLCNADELDDLIQDAFVKVWKGLPSFKRGAKLKTWIYRVTYNVALDNLRKRKQQTLELKAELISNGSNENEFMNKDLVQNGLSKLAEEHRSVLVLHCMEGLSVNEVSEITKVPEGTVKSRLHYARSKMHEILTKNGVSL